MADRPMISSEKVLHYCVRWQVFSLFVDMGGVGFGSRLQCGFLVKESPFLLAQA